DDVSDEELALVARLLDSREEWERWAVAQPYDGVLGSLPDWMGPEIQKEFLRVRGNVLHSNYGGHRPTPDDVRLWVDRFARLGETEQKEYIPEYYFHQIELLAHWRYLHSRGKSRGQTEIAGADFADNALIGERH